MSQDLVAINVRETNSSRQHRLGTKYVTEDDKTYRYAKAGASNLAVAELMVNPDVDTNVVNKTVAATYAVGATQVLVNVAGTVVQDAYQDGTFTISDATGEGVNYRVVGNTGVTGSGTVTVSLATPLTLALTVSVSEYTLTKNPWDAVVVSATDQADMAVGVPNVAIASGEYGWLQTRGQCSVLWDEAVAKGLALTIGTGTAGAVEALDGAGEVQIGVASQAGVDTEHQTAFLTID